MTTLSFQTELRPIFHNEFSNIYGSSDYRDMRDILIKMDKILVKSGLEHKLVAKAANEYTVKNNSDLSGKKASNLYSVMSHALRCNIARHLAGAPYKEGLKNTAILILNN